MKVFASYNSNERIRRESSSGGIFSILAETILSEGGSVYGAAFDENWKVRHIRVTDKKGLAKLRGSKYVFSDLGKSLREVEEDLNVGRKVLFSGTPCQIAALRKKYPEHPNLLLVEIVCHGAPEPKYWERYLDELLKKKKLTKADIKSISFRDKVTGWKNYSFTINYKDGKQFSQLHDDNLYMRAFLGDYTLRPACFKCPFKYPDGSKADITLGDLWGSNHLVPELDDDKGLTLIIVTTSKGLGAVRSINLKAMSYRDVVNYNKALISSPSYPNDLEAFKDHTSVHSFLKSIRTFADKPLLLKVKIWIWRLLH